MDTNGKVRGGAREMVLQGIAGIGAWALAGAMLLGVCAAVWAQAAHSEARAALTVTSEAERNIHAQPTDEAAIAQAEHNEARGAFEVTSQLGRRLYAQTDDDAVIAARKKLAADPKNVSLVLALSQAQAGRRQYREAVATCTKGLEFAPKSADLYIERGHRELGLREFRSAERDLAHAAALDPTKLDAFYHLGLAHYFQGQFGEAAESFQKALALAKNDDSVIDCTNWVYVSLRRAGKKAEAAQALKRIGPEVKNTEPHLLFYLRLERFYQGALTEQAVLPAKPADPNDVEAELSFDTVTYGVGNWHFYNGDAKRATELFRQAVSGNAWNAWGFVGAETDLARARSLHMR